MIPANTTSNIESNTTWTVMTTTAARMVSRTRMGAAIFPPPDAQLAEAMDRDV